MADTKVNTGGSAFPSPLDESEFTEHGMTLRDYFAGQALSYLTITNFLASAMTPEESRLQVTNAAALAYWVADAMLAERDK